MKLQEEREWWEMRIKYPFVGDMQKRLDKFQQKLIIAGEEPIFVPQYDNSKTLCKSILGFDI